MIKKSFLFGKKKYSHFDRLFSGRDGLWDFDGECRVSVRMVSNYQYVCLYRLTSDAYGIVSGESDSSYDGCGYGTAFE